MTETNYDLLLGKMLANQESMKEEQAKMAAKLDDIDNTLRDHRDLITFLKGQRSVVVWVGSAIIAAATAMGLTANKLFVWFTTK